MTNGLVLTVALMVSGALFSLANLWVGISVFALGIIVMIGCMYASHLRHKGEL